MDKKSFWIGFIIGCFLCIFTLMFVFYKLAVQPDVSLNQIEVYSLNGDKENLDEYIGKPLVINLWATWCAPCIEEFPYFEKVKQEMGNNVNFVMISDETSNKITNFSNSKDFSFTYLRSAKELSEYGINSRPATYFYNAQGELITKHTGNLDSKSLKKLIEKIE